LWLDAKERKYVEEVGAMNVMFKIGDTVVTPALTGSILPGITRMSCIEILRAKGITVEERSIAVDEIVAAIQDGTLSEAWGTGTAAVVSPIGAIGYNGTSYSIANGKIGAVTQYLYDTLTGIQFGTTPDLFNWTHKL